MLDCQFVAIDGDSYNIEPNVVLPVVRKDVMFGSFHDEFGFRIIHEFFRVAKVDIGTGFDFDKQQQLAVPGHNINLGVLVTIIGG